MSVEFSKKIWPFNIIAEKIYDAVSRTKLCELYLEKLGEDLKILYPQYEIKQILKQYVSYKIMCILIFASAVTVLACVYSFALKESNSVTELKRQDYWGEDVSEQIIARSDTDEIPIDVNVSHQEISEEEMRRKMEDAAAKLPEIILGKNTSLDKITSDLNLVSEIPDTQIEVYWELEENDVVTEDGSILLENMKNEGTTVMFSAFLCYEDIVVSTQFCGNFVMPELGETELFKLKLLKKISKINEESVSDSSLVLPGKVDDVNVAYRKNEKQYSVWLLLICVPLLFFVQDEKLKKKKSARQNQMIIDYPEIVNKIVLYLGAGLTIQGAFELIAQNYLKNRKTEIKRDAYEEIVFMYREIQGGVSFRDSMEHFSDRCRVQQYRKLCMLMLQNMRKGSTELIGILRQEAVTAFEERKSAAKRLGEEAGTKMLIPMVIMLGIVLVILIVPAWMSFQL